MAKPNFEDAVVEVIRSLRPGEVTSYGEVAQEAGFPGAARAVGNLLKKTEGLPWWRVIRSDGTLATRKSDVQAQRLMAEGVSVIAGRVERSRTS